MEFRISDCGLVRSPQTNFGAQCKTGVLARCSHAKAAEERGDGIADCGLVLSPLTNFGTQCKTGVLARCPHAEAAEERGFGMDAWNFERSSTLAELLIPDSWSLTSEF